MINIGMIEYITPVQAAAEIGVTGTWIRRLCRDGRIPGARKLGLWWLVPRGARIAAARWLSATPDQLLSCMVPRGALIAGREPRPRGRPLKTLAIPD